MDQTDKDETIPSLNDEPFAKGEYILRIAVILAVIGLVIYGVIYFNSEEEEQKQQKNDDFVIESHMPPIVIAEAIKPEPPEKPPINTDNDFDRNGNKKLTWQERKRLPPELYSGTGSDQSKASAENIVKASQESDITTKVATEIELIQASILPNLDFLITAGEFIDCDIKNALDTAMAGMAVCYTPRDIYSDTGNILLLPRGTKITGESLSDVKQGQTRIAIIWNQAKTRDGVIISLKNSNGTDALGRAGVEGYSESHFFERFGAAIAVSLLQTTTQTAAQNLIPRNGGDSFNISSGGNGGGTEVVESILDQYRNIPVSIVKNEGESIRIAINKNLDFSSVYELEVKP